MSDWILLFVLAMLARQNQPAGEITYADLRFFFSVTDGIHYAQKQFGLAQVAFRKPGDGGSCLCVSSGLRSGFSQVFQ